MMMRGSADAARRAPADGSPARTRESDAPRKAPASTAILMGARESAARAFKRVSDAYTTLSDAYTRAEYDANLDDGGTGEDGLEGGGEAAQAPSFSPDMPSGPPGLKKRKGRPPRR